VGHPVIHWEIGARNAEKLQAFYANLFGRGISTHDQEYWLVEPAPEGGIGGGIMQVRGEMPPHVTFYVGVDDLEGTLTRVAELGGRTVAPPMPIPGVGAFALLEDPDGNVIGIMRVEG